MCLRTLFTGRLPAALFLPVYWSLYSQRLCGCTEGGFQNHATHLWGGGVSEAKVLKTTFGAKFQRNVAYRANNRGCEAKNNIKRKKVSQILAQFKKKL